MGCLMRSIVTPLLSPPGRNLSRKTLSKHIYRSLFINRVYHPLIFEMTHHSDCYDIKIVFEWRLIAIKVFFELEYPNTVQNFVIFTF